MRIAIALSCLFLAEICYGHGNPIRVDVVNERLTVSGGLDLSFGYVDMAFDDHEDSYLEDVGEVLLGITPGFNVNDMEPESQLHLEVVSRPDFSLPSAPERWLWFWNESTGNVAVAPNSPVLDVASQDLFGEVLLTQFEAPTPDPSMLVMAPFSSELGTHQHPLAYLLDNVPVAESGAYGFFVRLRSPNYQASEPFLIALNHSLSAEEYQLAAKEINAAARLPGDFNGDDVVDGADFLAWQRSFGSTTELAADGSLNRAVDANDLAIWKQNFDRTWPAAGAAIATPEPAASLLFAWAILALAKTRVQKMAAHSANVG
jgi:hypothetical protein